jgi:hypothetical protein
MIIILIYIKRFELPDVVNKKPVKKEKNAVNPGADRLAPPLTTRKQWPYPVEKDCHQHRDGNGSISQALAGIVDHQGEDQASHRHQGDDQWPEENLGELFIRHK